MEDYITDSLAMAICMQMSEEHDYLMSRLNIKKFTKLRYDTYEDIRDHLGMFLEHFSAPKDRNTYNMYKHIVNVYCHYADILKGRKYNGQEEASS